MPVNEQKLTPKQARFVEEYQVDLNATAAARRAGYSKNTCESIGYENLRKPQIQAALSQSQKERSHRLGITADRVVSEIAAVAFAQLTDVFTWRDNKVTLVDSERLEESSKKSIAEVKQTADGSLQVKLHDKNQALDKLCRHLGLYDAEKRIVDNTSSDGSMAIPATIRLVGPNGEDGDWEGATDDLEDEK